ncbi:LysR family transcriptional regulator [Salipiger sp. CCB-MM3]|uniref:LysR family transcriptional regulator n=1 Tax=Salipiger sp. CCB-MM3 TaxID=1792508 RepID=UPI00080AB5F6|nr:LysR family transcriptional regulator [Salipiger sp. CCB-MM3]ANT60993.1 LysR family transcriptional regulator [Salipiger sp. CCB-MM3]
MDTLRQMRLFMAIAEAGNLSAVARAWGVAPSTVTHGLKQLEDMFGTQLMLRTTRQLSLTPEGERFLGECRRILSDVDDVMTGFSDKGPLSGEIRLTATNDFGRQRVAPLVDRFMRLHPGLTIQMLLSDQVVDLVEGGFDIGIRTGPLQDSDLRARLLLRGRKCVCAAPEYWRRHGKPSHPRELAQHNCLVLGGPTGLQAYWGFRENGSRFRVRIMGNRQVNDGQTLREWAVAGAGVVNKSSFDIADDLAAGRLETALEEFTDEATNLYAVSPQRGNGARRVQELLDFLGRELAA